jgi:hypothetical protein
MEKIESDQISNRRRVRQFSQDGAESQCPPVHAEHLSNGQLTSHIAANPTA